MSLGTTGSTLASNGVEKLESLGVLTETVEVEAPAGNVEGYDAFGYATILNVSPTDINEEVDFTFA